MGRGIFISFLFTLLSLQSLFAQSDSINKPAIDFYIRDSIAYVQMQARQDSLQAVKDSLKVVSDSLSMVWLKAPEPDRPNKFIDSLVELYRIKNLDFNAWAKQFPAKVNGYDQGHLRGRGEIWVFFFIIFLLLFFAILKNAFSKELNLIVQSLYSNRLLNQMSKEENLFNSWPFVFLYILFGFTIGTFLYLCGRYFQLSYYLTGFQWMSVLSLVVLGLFTLKIIVLRLLGSLLNIQKLVRNYVSILYLSYFNAAILFLPIVVAFSLTPLRFSEIYIYLALLLTGAIFFLQFIRAGAIVLSEYRFPIVYLVLYICALEICPLVVLFKALRF
jgi:hypothetical protein